MRKRALAILAAGVILTGCAASNQQWHTNCEVTGKDTLYKSTDGDTHRVKRVSTSCGAYDVEDAWEVGQFDSWDAWQKLQVGKTYDIKTGGPRIGILDSFPIVLDVKGPKQVVK